MTRERELLARIVLAAVERVCTDAAGRATMDMLRGELHAFGWGDTPDDRELLHGLVVELERAGKIGLHAITGSKLERDQGGARRFSRGLQFFVSLVSPPASATEGR